jgi:hypothetical protein
MPILLRKRINDIDTIIVASDFTDDEMKQRAGTFLGNNDVRTILKTNADVYTNTGKLLLRFRKNVLPMNHIDAAYDAIKKFANKAIASRGIASGSPKSKRMYGVSREVRSNVIGFFDNPLIRERHMFKVLGIKTTPYKVHVSAFTRRYPEKWAATLPLIRDINTQYKLLMPVHYKKQFACAKQTAYRIDGTAFSTVTTNVNFQTALHKDSGDFDGGFGNLVVIERDTPYKGAYTCIPQYGIGVDVRMGDFLGMDVHQWHGNTPMIGNGSTRLSLVSYLRDGVWKLTQGSKPADIKANIAFHEDVYRRFFALSSKDK